MSRGKKRKLKKVVLVYDNLLHKPKLHNLTSFENANKISAMNTDVFAGWGMALMKQKRYNEAHEKFLESVRLNKYNFMALLLAAIMEVRTGQYNEAETKLNFLANSFTKAIIYSIMSRVLYFI